MENFDVLGYAIKVGRLVNLPIMAEVAIIFNHLEGTILVSHLLILIDRRVVNGDDDCSVVIGVNQVFVTVMHEDPLQPPQRLVRTVS